MAAIAQSNPYAALSRKIGYSVGLEYLLERVTALTTRYARERRLGMVDWRALVAEDFGRAKGPAFEHIANFFSTLSLIRIVGNEVHPLYGLEILAILRRFFENDDAKFSVALRMVLSKLVIEADGDITLNALFAGFERDATRDRIAGMVQTKWEALSRNLTNPGIQDKVWELVSIRSQGSDRIGEGQSGGGGPFAKRTQPLAAALRRREPREKERRIEVPDSYLDKILPTRKGWATDLNFFENGNLTDRGTLLLSRLGTLGLAAPNGSYVFWPYPHELAPLRISASDLGFKEVEDWGLLTTIAGVFGATIANAVDDEDALISLMRHCYDLYKTGSEGRGSIRHQIPLYVLKPVIAGIALGDGTAVPPLPSFVSKEIRGEVRRFDFTNIRGTEGALVFRGAKT